MKRKALQELIDWNNDIDRKPLIVWGARQVGKTYLIRDIFAKNCYTNSFIYIDFKIDDDFRDFCMSTANADKILEYISLRYNRKINNQTLIIFDEIQECPNIVSSLKYFCQDHREIPVIATGSMVRIKLQREMNKRGVKENGGKFLFPVGKINQITLYPMTFEEYLLNANESLLSKLRTSYLKKEPLDNQIHSLALDYVYRYFLIGGMPEAVDSYIKSNNLMKSRKLLKELHDNYLCDMELYQASKEAILRSKSLFENIYRELNKESKNFSPGLIEEKSKTRDYLTSIQWLTMARIVNVSHQLKEHVTLPLVEEENSNFRLYLSDIGMFSYQSGINASSFISTERENVLSGIFFENFVANELVAKDLKLCYWKGKSTSEIEFILESDNRLYPLDVKKGRGTLDSISNFSNHNKYEFAIKVSKNNYGFDKEKRIMTIPFYFMSFLAEDISKGNLTATKE